MTANLKRALACCCFGIGLALLGSSAAEPWQVVTVNRASLEGTLKDGTEFEVRVESQEPKEAAANYFGATGKPRSVVSDIIMKVGGKRISFPDPSFNDLADALLQTLSITSQSSGEVKLRFTGGEGDASYEVEYFIEGNRLVRRTVSYFERGAEQKDRVIKTMTF